MKTINFPKEKMGYIYEYQNTTNGKRYIGQSTKDIEAKERQHINGSKKKTERLFYADLIKYGRETFNFTILERDIPKDKLLERESFWIRDRRTFSPYGYNMTFMDEKGKNVYTDEWHKAHENGLVDYYSKPETYGKLSKIRKGQMLSDKTKRRISESMREYLREHPEALQKRNQAAVEERKTRHLYFIQPPDEPGFYLSGGELVEFCKCRNLHRNILYNVANGKSKHHKGYILTAYREKK